jgi:hypothetical protein
MDTRQIAEKLFNFCEGRYPDLKWAWDYYSGIDNCKDVSLILGSCSLFKLELEIRSEEKQERYSYDQVSLNHDKNGELEFTIATHDGWNDDSWLLVKQARKIAREIFNFIEDEIQE